MSRDDDFLNVGKNNGEKLGDVVRNETTKIAGKMRFGDVFDLETYVDFY